MITKMSSKGDTSHILEISMKKFLLGAAVLMSATAISSQASAQSLDDLSVSVSTDYVSEYVFRGVSFANTAIQPGISVSTGGFTLGAWASVGLGDSSIAAADEIDIYGSYGWNLSDAVSASVGFTVYHFPQSGGLFNGLFENDSNGSSSFELNGGLSFDTVLSPSVTTYYDIDLEAFTLQGSVSHSVPLAEKTSLNLGLTAGLVEAGNGGTDYQWGTGSASLGYAFNDASSMYVGGNFSVNSDDLLGFPDFDSSDLTADISPPDNALFWAGVGFSTGF